jgi:thioredoxin-like negative regulator of GroEL
MRQEETGVQRRAWVLLVGVMAAGGGFWAFDLWRLRADWQQAKHDVAMGKPASALARLTRLARRWPGHGEVLYDLGACELILGHEDRAGTVWAQIPADSPVAPRAAMMRARLNLKRHRLSVAEGLLREALRAEAPLAIEARETLVNIYKIQGRYDEARRLVRDGWRTYPDQVGTLQELARLDSPTPLKLEQAQPNLDEAVRVAPDDDRVWLGLANVATRTGRFSEARRWLDGCLRRHPDDPVVWRARLDWAKAAEEDEEARRALRHLPSDRLMPSQLLSLRAWFARRAGAIKLEQRTLEELIARDRGAIWAMERLAELLLLAGRPAEAEKWRHIKGDQEKTQDWYVYHIFPKDRLDHAPELARAAEKVGRMFEARCWWELAAIRPEWAGEAGDQIARLDSDAAQPATDVSVPTPASLVAQLDGLAPIVQSGQDPRPGGAMPHFTNDAEAARLRFTFDCSVRPARQMPEASSGGVALLDYDGDGWMDVFVVQGGPFPPPVQSTASSPDGGDRLFRNRRDGTFEDVSLCAGISSFPRGYGHGVAVGDIDNDGWPDLFITRWRSYALFRNRGNGTFEDVTAAWGLGGNCGWPTSAAFGDFDGDGNLDLYVCQYCEWDSEHPPSCYDQVRKSYGGCSPPDYPALPDRLYRNDGSRFVDISERAGITKADANGRGLGVLSADLDGDGRTDIFVANDQSAKYLFLNRGGSQFEEMGQVNGIAGNSTGDYQASMGVACGDVDGDGRLDLAVTNFYNEYTAFYRNLGDGIFADHTASVGLAVSTRYRLGFGIAFLDVNNDGRLDLVTANGHVDDFRPGVPYHMRPQLFTGSDDGRQLVDVSDRAGRPFQVPLLGRGLAVGDLDNDGRVDILIVSQGQPLSYFHNQTENGGHWLTLLLEGSSSNRDAVGARVKVVSGRHGQVGWRIGGGSYQSASDPRLHFGLGKNARVELVEVVWPSGKVDQFKNLSADTGHMLREGDRQPHRLEGFADGRAVAVGRRSSASTRHSPSQH